MNISTLIDADVIRGTGEAAEFPANVLEASTEYSIIGKDLDRKILLWNEGAHRLYGDDASEVIGKANSLMTTDPLGIITDVNQQMEALTGATRAELSGSPFKNYDRAGAITLGAEQFLCRPVEPQVLLAELAKVPGKGGI